MCCLRGGMAVGGEGRGEASRGGGLGDWVKAVGNREGVPLDGVLDITGKIPERHPKKQTSCDGGMVWDGVGGSHKRPSPLLEHCHLPK